MKGIKAELELIRKRNRGRLTAISVLRYAEKNKGSAVWTRIDKAGLWNTEKAAHRARLLFCQQIILRVKVRVLTNGRKETTRAYVNLLSGRQSSGGYRSVVELMQSETGRSAILETAISELQAFKRKYSLLKELGEVFAAIRNVEEILLDRNAAA
jgi:hypothetical protein